MVQQQQPHQQQQKSSRRRLSASPEQSRRPASNHLLGRENSVDDLALVATIGPRGSWRRPKTPSDQTQTTTGECIPEETEVEVETSGDRELFEILKFSPWHEEERAKFDNSLLRKHVLTHPDGVKAMYDWPRSERQYPLIRAIGLGASIDVVKMMYKICPKAIEYTGRFRKTCLHASVSQSLEVMEYVLRRYPAAAEIRTKHAYYPLHNACEYGVSSTRVIELLIRAYPQALLMKNKLARRPLETAQAHSSTHPKVLKLLEKATTRQEKIEAGMGKSFSILDMFR